jgi:RimJ/RimL family protein N-acetyltransferase
LRIDTPRLILRPPNATDVQPMFDIHQDPDVMRFVGKPGTITVAWRNVAMMIGHWQMRGYGMWIVVERHTGEVIGRAGLWNEAGGPGLELGWLIRKSSWGRGFATEASRAALDWTWAHVDADRVISVIHADNLPSIRIAEKLGMSLERTEMRQDGDTCVYAVKRAFR